MAEIKEILGSSFAAATNQKASNDQTQALGQEDFLKLLITQMSYQDPMNPQDPGDFVSQMAQFGTVDGINQLNNSFNQMNTQLQSNQALHASAMVGRKVHVQSDFAVLDSQQGLHGSVNLTEPTTDLVVSFKNQQGETVKQLPLGAKTPGIIDYTWNGIDDQGKVLEGGKYHMLAEATVAGKRLGLATNAVSNVDSVTLGQGGQGILLNLRGVGTVKMSDVEKIT